MASLTDGCQFTIPESLKGYFFGGHPDCLEGAARLVHIFRLCPNSGFTDPKHPQSMCFSPGSPNGAPCFGWKKPCSLGLTFKNRGQLGSRYTNY